MKTICAKTNPAFKRTQLLPVIVDLLPPTTGAAARHFSEFNPSETAKDQAHQMPAALIRANQPAIRLLN